MPTVRAPGGGDKGITGILRATRPAERIMRRPVMGVPSSSVTCTLAAAVHGGADERGGYVGRSGLIAAQRRGGQQDVSADPGLSAAHGAAVRRNAHDIRNARTRTDGRR